jgi:uncharacterized SAM-binding protein YcdF (DUF218 family)
MEVLLVKTIQTLLLPPGLMILLMLAGYLLAPHLPRTGKTILFTGFALLVLASMPLVARMNLRLLEVDSALPTTELAQPSAQVIVVLSGGRNLDAPEYGKVDTVNMFTLERLRYAAWLQRRTHLPILITGGKVFGSSRPAEAELIQQVLTEELQIPVTWIETNSRNSWENASFSQAILKETGITRIYLVTQAWHMPRARMAFEAVGLEVIPAPTGFSSRNGDAPLILDFLPSADALMTNYYVAHEWLGILWYQLRYL